MNVDWHSFCSTYFSGYVYELRELEWEEGLGFQKQADDFSISLLENNNE